MARKLNAKNIDTVVLNIKSLFKADQKVIFKQWNEVLDELLLNDFFGTEGQLDPRGDHRNDE